MALQFQEATVITLLELSDMNEELDQFHHNTKKKQPDYIVADLKAITDFVKLSLHHENLSELEKGVEYLVENYTLLYFCSSITANSVPMLLNDYEEKKINEFSWYNHKFDREKPFPAIKTWRDLWHTP